MTNYSEGLSRSSDPLTSKEAGLNLNPTKLEAKVLEIIKQFPYGCISEQVEHRMWVDFDTKASSVTPRYRKLLEKRLITITGTMIASSGRHQQLMRAV